MNYRTGEMRVIKRPKKAYDAFEFPVTIDITIEVPELPKAEIKGNIKVPQAKVNEMVVTMMDEINKKRSGA